MDQYLRASCRIWAMVLNSSLLYPGMSSILWLGDINSIWFYCRIILPVYFVL